MLTLFRQNLTLQTISKKDLDMARTMRRMPTAQNRLATLPDNVAVLLLTGTAAMAAMAVVSTRLVALVTAL